MFAALYIACSVLLVILNLQFGLQHPALRITALVLGAYGAAAIFIRQQRAIPTKRDTWILSAGSLCVFCLMVVMLQRLAKIPFNSGIFALQGAAAFAVFYFSYGHMARKYLGPTLPKSIRGETTDIDPSFPKEGTFYPGRYQPSTISAEDYINEHGSFPLPDRSNINREYYTGKTQRDLGWGQGTIFDGEYDRPFFMEVWAEEGHFTLLTFFFSRIGIEDLIAEAVADMFEQAEILEWTGHKKMGFHLIRAEDRNKHPIWSFNVCVGASDKIYVTKSPPYRRYLSD